VFTRLLRLPLEGSVNVPPVLDKDVETELAADLVRPDVFEAERIEELSFLVRA
jgi:hypothetical protein